jgi:hypothetical protein
MRAALALIVCITVVVAIVASGNASGDGLVAVALFCIGALAIVVLLAYMFKRDKF